MEKGADTLMHTMVVLVENEDGNIQLDGSLPLQEDFFHYVSRTYSNTIRGAIC